MMKAFPVILTVFCLLVTLTVPFAAAEQYHMTLLTVSDTDSGWEGGTADLYLEVKPGSGRIFIDSFPLSKLDTQFSTRYANEIACEFTKKECDQYDFFYTIRAGSSVVGGPSAGAAIAILTIAALDRQPVAQDVAITGTINSGGLVGPVAGVIAKAQAGRDAGMKTIIIPTLTSLAMEEYRQETSNETAASTDNVSLNFSLEYDDQVLESLSDDGFTVIQVSDLYEALPHFIVKEYLEPSNAFTVDPQYKAIMEEVAHILCDRREVLIAEQELDENMTNATNIAEEQISLAFGESEFYSAASYCFTQNIDLRSAQFATFDQPELREELNALRLSLGTLKDRLDGMTLHTISDIETSAIVRERIIETEDTLAKLDDQNISAVDLAYAVERGYSAEVWSAFFRLESEPYLIDDTYLWEACMNKIGEAEERVSYVETYLPAMLTTPGREELDRARVDRDASEYALCLFKASKAKAEANILSSVLSISEPRLETLVDRKLQAAERVLSEQAARGLFPIMGYSYYEYAVSLQEDQPYSALTFAEYALELSQLHLYFPHARPWYEGWTSRLPVRELLIFVIGFFVGVLVLHLIVGKKK